MDKGQVRRELQKCLLAITPEQRSSRSRKACEYLASTSEFQDASVIMMFLSLPKEIDTSQAILAAWQLGKTVVAPKVLWQERHMIPVEIHSLDAGCETEASGLRNPISGVPTPLEQIDLVVTPGLGFDRSGNRLGWGGAYYDKFFAHEQLTATRCGFGFAEQLLDSVPATEHDQPVDFVVTDEGVVHLYSRKGV
jgi:5-formyltetrahydrofolate cyclo-ligase